MRHATALTLLTLSIALSGCGDEPQAAKTTAKQSAEQTVASPAPEPIDAPEIVPIPAIDIEKHAEAPVREELARYLERATTNPDDAIAVGTLGMKCFAYGYAPEAKDCFQRAAALAPHAFKWSYFLGFALENVGDQNLAIGAYERALEIDPKYQPAYTRLATLLLDSDPERACELFATADDLVFNEARATWGLAQCARLAGDLDQAEALYRKAITLEPTYAKAHFGIAQVLARTNRPNEAQEHFTLQKAGREASDYRDQFAVELGLAEFGAAGTLRKASGLVQRGQTEDAINALLDGIALQPDHPALRLQLAQLRLNANEYELAKNQLALVRKDLPDNIGARSMRAAIHALENEPDKAEALLRDILDDNPDEAASNWLLGQVLLARGDQDEAMRFLARGAELQAFNPNVQIQLAQLHAGREELREAAICLRRASIASQGNDQLLAEADRLDRLADERESSDDGG